MKLHQQQENVACDDTSVSNFPVSRSGKPFESRDDWALCWPKHRKSQIWQADHSGVVSRKFWVNAWRNPADFGIQLKAKDSAVPDIWRCRLQADPSGRYVGTLQLEGRNFYVELWQDVDQRVLRIHFSEGGEP